ncbi:hypothetical protein GQ54DRAFT_314622 [Martensiomyces pterosporus]|nr:hypothetical protein GQ54DRAFT_314622 [Martensiomyces pterosporus]
MDPAVLRITGTIVPPHTHLPHLSMLECTSNIHTASTHNEFGQPMGELHSTADVRAANPRLREVCHEAPTAPGALNRIAGASWISVMDPPRASLAPPNHS